MTPKKRVLICGGREYDNIAQFMQVMESVRPYLDPKYCIITGLAHGADSLGHWFAVRNGIPLIGMPANWMYFDKAAGTIRNGWMLEYATPDLVIAFPGGPGTRDMIARSRARGIDVLEVARGAV